MKKGWEIRKLGQVLSIQNGYAFQSSQYSESGAFVMRIGNVQDGFIELNNPKYIKLNKKDLERFVLSVGDILVSLTGNVGRVGMIEENHLPAVLNQRVARISVLDESKLLKNYLFYFLKSSYFIKELIEAGHGAAQQNISTKDIENLEIPLPPLSEQKETVAVLDKAFTDIAKAKDNAVQNLKNAKELFESYLQSVFNNKGDGWEERTLGEVYDVRDGTHDSPKYQDAGFPLITSKNLKKDLLNYNNVNYISEKDYININKRSKVDKGDILFAMIGTIGNPVVIQEEPSFAIKNVALFKIPETHNSYFLKYYLDSKTVIDQMMSDAKGTTQKFVGLGYLRDFKINVPALKEQLVVVKKLGNLSIETKKLEKVYQQKVNDLEELKKSILQKAFSGELKNVKV